MNFAIPTPYYVGHAYMERVCAKIGISPQDRKNDDFAPRPVLIPNFFKKKFRIIVKGYQLHDWTQRPLCPSFLDRIKLKPLD